MKQFQEQKGFTNSGPQLKSIGTTTGVCLDKYPFIRKKISKNLFLYFQIFYVLKNI